MLTTTIQARATETVDDLDFDAEDPGEIRQATEGTDPYVEQVYQPTRHRQKSSRIGVGNFRNHTVRTPTRLSY